MSFQNIKGKLAYYFLELARENGSNQFNLKINQNELAEYFGVTRPSLARVIKELNYNGIMKSKGKQIHIKDRNALEKLADRNFDPLNLI